MNELGKRVGLSFGYFDSRTNGDLSILRSVDITDECPHSASRGETVILDFTRATEGAMVKVTQCYVGVDYGMSVVYLLHELENLDNSRTRNFCQFASGFGLKVEQLLKMVRDLAPM